MNPCYPLLLEFGFNAHLPIPQVVDDSWSESSRPTIEFVEKSSGLNNVVILRAGRGVSALKKYPVNDAEFGVVLVGGVGGAFDSPAQGLFYKLGKLFMREKILTLRCGKSLRSQRLV